MAAKKQVKAARKAVKKAGKAAKKSVAKKATSAKKAVNKAVNKGLDRLDERKAAKSIQDAEHDNAVARAEHAHQDPRGTPAQIHAEQAKVQAQNFGQTKNRRVPRMDRVTNWFRRGQGR